MTKCLVKFIIAVLISVVVVQAFSINFNVNADTVDPMNEVINVTTSTTDSELPGILSNVGGTFITVFQVVGVGVALIMLIVLAMKYMLASASDKADIKKHAIVYIVGAMILFSASGILGIINNLSKNFNE